MKIRRILFVQRDWRIAGIPFAERKFRPTAHQNEGIGG
jgi:hypothetical protein